MREISWLAENLLVNEEGLGPMELVRTDFFLNTIKYANDEAVQTYGGVDI